MKKLRLLLLLACIPASLSAQIIYYVSDSGNDMNPGSETQPFGTLQHCVDQWNDTSWISCRCAGTFHEEVEITAGGPSASERNQLIAWDTDKDGDLEDETFVLDGENTRNVGIMAPQGPKPDNIEIAYLTIQNYFPDGGCGDGGDLHYIRIQCSGGVGCTDWWIHHCTFQNMGQDCNAGSSYISIQPSNADRLLVEHNTFLNSAGYLMRYVRGNNITFRYNTAEILATGIKAWGEPCDSFQIYGNTFNCDGNGYHDPAFAGQCGGQNAVNFSNNIQHGLIKDNVFNHCVTAINIGVDERFGYRDNAHHLIEGNIINHSDSACNRWNSAVVFGGCSPFSQLSGDSLEVRDIVFRNNVVYYSGDGIWHQGSALLLRGGHPHDFNNNFEIYNNTFSGFRWGIRIDECKVGGINGTPYPHQLKGVKVQNNIFAGIRDEQIVLSTSGKWDGPFPKNFESDHNVFDRVNEFGWGGIIDFQEWQDSLGQDLQSSLCLPQFVGIDDFHLKQADSCARDRGVALSSFGHDLEGNPRPISGFWDIGAYQYQDSIINGLFSDKETAMNWELFPNPGSGVFHIRLKTQASTLVKLTLFDLQGKKIKEQVSRSGQLIRFDAGDLSDGLYLLGLEEGDSYSTQKLILQRR